MKINGKVVRLVNEGTPLEFPLYRVLLRGGPANGLETYAGNTTTVFCGGHRYELNENGDFVYNPGEDDAGKN